MQHILAEYTPKQMPVRDGNASIIDMNFNGINNAVKLSLTSLVGLISSFNTLKSVAVTGFGSRTTQVGLTAVTGTSDLAARADSAPALSQAISPVWSADHVFQQHAYFGGTSSADAPAHISYVVSEGSYLDINCSEVDITGDYFDVWSSARIHDSITVDGLTGTGTRLIGANFAGVVDDYTTFAGSYTFSSTVNASISGSAPAGLLTGATLNATVTASSLTSVGTLTSLSVAGITTATGHINVNGATDATNYGVNIKDMHAATTGGFTFNAFGLGVPGATNQEFTYIGHNGTNAFLTVTQAGSGAYRPLLIQNGGSTAITVATNQAVTFSSSATVSGALIASTTLAVTGITTATGHINVNGATDFTNYGVNVKSMHVVTSGGFGHRAFGLGVPGDTNTEFAYLSHNGTNAFLTVTQAGSGAYRDLIIQNNGSTQMTVLAAGGVTVANALTASSTLAVTGTSTLTGNVAIGTTTTAGSQVLIRSATLATATSYGIDCAPTFQVGVTTANAGYFEVKTQASGSLTVTTATGIKIGSPTVGAGSSITNLYGLDIADQTAGTLVNGALRTGSGTVLFGGAVTCQTSLTVSSTTTLQSTLAVTGATTHTGNVAVGVVSTSIALRVSAATLTGADQFGIVSEMTFGSSATSNGRAMQTQLITANASFTMASGYGLFIASPSKGAASTITTAYGLFIENQSAGGTNYAIKTGTGLHDFGGLLITIASATGSAGFRLPHGAAPSSPVNGDMWTTTAGLFVRINGTTKTVTLT